MAKTLVLVVRQSIKMLSSEVTWCARCSYRFSTLNSKLGVLRLNRVAAFAQCSIQRKNSTDVIPPPTFEGEAKRYAPKIEKLVSEISQLTLIEVADLNELLKKTLKIADMPAMSFAAAGQTTKPTVQEEEDSAEPVKQEKTLFTVKMVKYDEAKKVAVIKEVKNIVAGMNLVQAKKFVESLPQTLKVDVSKEESEKLKAAIEAVGAVVEIE